MWHYLISLGLMSTLVNGDTEFCNYPKEWSASGLSAKTYMIGTRLDYECTENFEGLLSNIISHNCEVDWNDNEIYPKKAKWTEYNCCIEIGSTDQECGTTVDETTWTDSCGPPAAVPNAVIDPDSIFPLGQEFFFSLNGNNHTQDEPSGGIKCMDCDGHIMWVNMTDGCPRSELRMEEMKTNGWAWLPAYSSKKTETTHRPYTTVKEDTMPEASAKNYALPRYIIIITVLTIMVMSLAIFGKRIWKEMSTRKTRNPTKSDKLGCENENERNSTVIPLNKNI